MTDNSTTPGDDATPTSETPTKRPRRRAASRPAGPPTAAATDTTSSAAPPSAPDVVTTEPAGAEVPPVEPSEPPAPVKKAARKRAVKKAAAPAPQTESVAPADSAAPVDGPAPSDSGADDTAGEPAPAKKATRKRATRARKAVDAPVEAPTTDDAPEPAAGAAATATTDEQAPGTADETPVRATRRRTRRTAAADATASAAEPAAEQAVPAEQAETVTSDEQDTEDRDAEDQETEGQDAEDQAPGAPGPVPVLFQAPDLSAATAPRRRRAATRPAGPPQHHDEEPAAPADASDAEDAEDAEDTVAPSTAADEAVDEGAEDDGDSRGRRRRRRGGRGRRRRGDDQGDSGTEDGSEATGSADGAQDAAADAGAPDDAASGDDEAQDDGDGAGDAESSTSRRRRRRRRRGGGGDADLEPSPDDPANTVVKVRQPRRAEDEVTGLKGSTRLEAKRQRRREGRESGRRKPIVTEAEFLARRESVERVMVVREREGRTQIAVLEDGVLVEHFVARKAQASMIGNVYLGKVQNVLPSMEAAFVDIGKGRNAVLYAGEVNWDAAGLEGQPRRIEVALKSGDPVLVQVTKDPVGTKGSRLTSQVSLPGRYLVYVPHGSMTGISRKLPDTERARLKKILKAVVPDEAGVIVRTAAEGASEEELQRDVARLQAEWERIEKRSNAVNAPALLHGEPDLTVKVIRDVFNEDFARLVVAGDEAWQTVEGYVREVAPDLVERLTHWDDTDGDVFAKHRIDEQIAKAVERKVWLPSGGSLVIDRTEAMTVVDVNTGKFVGSGGNLEATVTKNNLEAAEEIVRQLRLRDVGGIIVIDFIDMVLESNRDLVMRRLLECLGRDRTKHQVAEVTSLGLVQMTRKRVGQGLIEAFSEQCEHCGGRGVILHDEPVVRPSGDGGGSSGGGSSSPSQPRSEKQLSKKEKAAAAAEERRRAEQAAAVAKVAAAARAKHEAEEAAAASGAASAPTEATQGETGQAEPAAAPVVPGGDAVLSDGAPAAEERAAEESVTPPHGDELTSGPQSAAPTAPQAQQDGRDKGAGAAASAAASPVTVGATRDGDGQDGDGQVGGDQARTEQGTEQAGGERPEPAAPVKAPRRRRRATAQAQAPAASSTESPA